MNTKTITLLTAVLFIGLGGYLYLNAGKTSSMMMHSPTPTTDTVPHGMHRMPDGSLMSNTHMGGMDHGSMMVESEREFLEGMIPHHQEAVDTAKEVLARGATTPEIKTLVENIITAQEKEITEMKVWYQTWYGTPYTPSSTYEPMMRDLSTLSGAAIDAAFLEDMIPHHMGAIMMARSVQPHIEHEEIRTLTEAIVTSQTAEIQLMQQLRTGIQ